ncbi:MAG TPA: hypothetical protein VJ574_08835, partial [Candidatus Bathyarchaeia archaeon]|nr:hypothetical protein [Candidatus Bathyarchaeia archaeon]
AAGLAGGMFYSNLQDAQLRTLISQSVVYLFPAIPTFAFIYGLVFTLMGQLQKMGAQSSVQLPYWLPITWEEHTLASTLSNLFGLPLAALAGASLGILAFSAFLGQLLLAILTVLTLLASAFLGSTTTEIFNILQVRLIGAVYKSSGKAAVWVRFAGSLTFFILFYMVWFFLTSGSDFIYNVHAITDLQLSVWFIPYVWLGVAVASFAGGLFINALVFLSASVIFIMSLFYLATRLNSRFGLYEPPAITISRGVYVPRVSVFRRMGFTPTEAAIMGKDFRAFTRKRQLMSVFLLPVVFVIIPLMQYLGIMGSPVPPEASPFLSVELILGPGALAALMIGTVIIGQEGPSAWNIYSSPVSARSFVKSKYATTVILSSIVAIICSLVGALAARPPINLFIGSFIGGFLLIIAVGAVSLRAGINGADLTEAPRPRMVNQTTAFVNMFLCLAFSLAILSPLIIYRLRMLPSLLPPGIGMYIAIFASTAISLIISYAFYRKALNSAKDFLARAAL